MSRSAAISHVDTPSTSVDGPARSSGAPERPRFFSWGILALIVMCLAVIAACIPFDRWAFAAFEDVFPLEENIPLLIARMTGDVRLWLIVLLVWVLVDRRVPRCRRPAIGLQIDRAAVLFWTIAAAAAAAEVLKITIRRERPLYHDGESVFRPWTEHDWWHSGGLSTPSSEATIAFAAAWTLSWMYPRFTAVWFAIALGAPIARLSVRAHFLSDLAVALLAALLVSRWMWVLSFRPGPRLLTVPIPRRR